MTRSCQEGRVAQSEGLSKGVRCKGRQTYIEVTILLFQNWETSDPLRYFGRRARKIDNNKSNVSGSFHHCDCIHYDTHIHT